MIDENKKPEVKAIATGHISKHEKTFGEKVAENFVSSDMRTVRDHIVYDTILPGIKNSLYDTIESFFRMILFGEKEGSRTRRDGGRSYPYVSYSESFDRSRRRRERDDLPWEGPRTARSLVDDIIFDTRGDAEEVLSEMIKYIEEYDAVTVKELYGFVGLDSDYTKEKYGWTNLNRAEVVRVREGYVLKLPRPILLD